MRRIDFVRGLDGVGILRRGVWDRGAAYPRLISCSPDRGSWQRAALTEGAALKLAGNGARPSVLRSCARHLPLAGEDEAFDGGASVRVLRGDGAGLAEEREEIQRPRRRPEDGWRMCDGGGGCGHLRGVYGWRGGPPDRLVGMLRF